MPDSIAQIKEFILPFLKKNGLFLGLFLSGITLTSYGLFSGPQEDSEIELVRAAESENLTSNSKILVDVSGAVVAPGMYELEKGARIQDALVMAGGFDEKADKDYISQYLNLAQKLSDGTKIFIPKENQQTKSIAGASTVATLTNINTASESELDKLPAIGIVTAGKIIDGRPYQDIGELVDKNVVGQKTFDKVKDLISVY